MLSAMDATGARATAGVGHLAEVLVAADHHLMAETICAALGSLGYPTEQVAWMSARPGPASAVTLPRPDAGDPATDRLLLVVCDLDVTGRLIEARDIGRHAGTPWLVVDASGPGPAWGALLEAGARTVVVSSISLDALAEVLDTVAGGGSSLSELERHALVRQWKVVKKNPERMWRPLLAMDSGEREILTMLHEGTTVSAIAARFGLSEAAVRSQVKAVLRRLASGP
jgi:DNA-binding NarL/FixJ family response regulator